MSSYAARVFISHSAHVVDEPATQRFLDELVASVHALPDCLTLTNQRDLAAGDEWLQQLYAWMGLCDAAIILLSPRAVLRENSRWVPRETNLLLWRKALDPDFLVIPVLLGGVTPKDVAHHPFMHDIRLNHVQIAQGLSDEAKIARIVDVLRDRFAGTVRRRTFDPVHANVDDAIDRYASAYSVEEVLRVHYGHSGWLPGIPPHRRLSLQMVRHAGTEEVDGVIAHVTLGSQGEAQLGLRLFESLFPLRLPAETACRLLALCREQEGRGAVLVNANDTWVVRMLLRAASGLPRYDLARTWLLVELQNDWHDNDQAEITLRMEEELANAVLGTGGWGQLGSHPDPAIRLQQQRTLLAEHLREARDAAGAPIVVCARHTARWEELAATLAAQFPTVVLLFWSGDDLPAETARPGACLPLEPAWSSGKDRHWQLTYRRKIHYFTARPA